MNRRGFVSKRSLRQLILTFPPTGYTLGDGDPFLISFFNVRNERLKRINPSYLWDVMNRPSAPIIPFALPQDDVIISSILTNIDTFDDLVNLYLSGPKRFGRILNSPPVVNQLSEKFNLYEEIGGERYYPGSFQEILELYDTRNITKRCDHYQGLQLCELQAINDPVLYKYFVLKSPKPPNAFSADDMLTNSTWLLQDREDWTARLNIISADSGNRENTYIIPMTVPHEGKSRKFIASAFDNSIFWTDAELKRFNKKEIVPSQRLFEHINDLYAARQLVNRW